jgi:hypothetical protein
MKSGSRGFIQNLFCNFWTLLQVSTDFESLHYVLRIKTIEKRFKNRRTLRGRKSPRGYGARTWRPVMRGRSEGWLGHSLVTQSSHRCGPRAACASVVTTRGATQWLLAGSKVLG